jgi:hypothetical protein
MPYKKAVEIQAALEELKTTFPLMCTGDFCPNDTLGGRRVPFIKITHPDPPAAPRRAILLLGGLHSNEWAPPDALVSFARTLLERAAGPAPNHRARAVSYGPVARTDVAPAVDYPRQMVARTAVRSIFQNLDIYIAPLINPDGRDFSLSDPVATRQYWRKNRKTFPGAVPCIQEGVDVSVGVDINRNFRVAWRMEDYYETAYADSGAVRTARTPCGSGTIPGRVYRGPDPESERETANVIWLQETTSNARWVVDVHSYGPHLLYGWGMANNQSTNKAQNFQNPAFDHARTAGAGASYGEYIPSLVLERGKAIAGRMRTAILKMASPDPRVAANPDLDLGSEYEVQESVGLYPATGASTDFVLSLQFQTLSAPPFDAVTVPPQRQAFTIECGSYFQNKFWPKLIEQFPKVEREIHLALWGTLAYAASPSTSETVTWPVKTT